MPLKLLLALLLSWNTQQRCLADVMWAEARGESVEQRIAVAAVVINRAVRDSRSICSIVRMPHQFVSKHAPSLAEAYIATVIYPILPDHFHGNFNFHSGSKQQGIKYDVKIKGENKFY